MPSTIEALVQNLRTAGGSGTNPKPKRGKQKAITKTQRREKCFVSKDTDCREKTEASLESVAGDHIKNQMGD